VFFLSEHPNRFSSKVASVAPRLHYSPHILGVAHFLRIHMGANDAVVIDNYNEESNVVAQAAGMPLITGDRAFKANTAYDQTVDQYIAIRKPRFVVYSDQGTLRRSLNLPPDAETQESMAWITSARSRTRSIASISSRSRSRIDLSGLTHALDPGQHSIDVRPRIPAIGRLAFQFAVGRQMIVAIQAVVQLCEAD